MADGADLVIDGGAIDRDADRMVRQYLTAGTVSIATTTKALERELEAVTRAAVPGQLWRAWASESYPRSGPARDPVGEVFINGRDRSRGAMTFWSQPGSIRGKNGQFLAIPLPAAGSRGRGRDLTPGEWEQAHPGVRLRFVYRTGRASLLVVDGGVLNGRTGTYRAASGKRAQADAAAGRPIRQQATIPIFALVPMVPFRNTVAIEPIIRQFEADIPVQYLRALQQILTG